jgi:hypothetical protein
MLGKMPTSVSPTARRAKRDAPPATARQGSPVRAANLWPLVLAGLVLEMVWLIVAALTYPLSASPAYIKGWPVAIGPFWSVFEWILVQLDALAPGVYGGDLPHTPAVVVFVGALLLGCAVYILAIHALDGRLGSHPAAPGVVAIFALLFQVTLWLMPGILTTDLATYAVYGRIAGVYNANPYVVPPSAFPDDLFVPWWLSRVWITTTASYGPLWIDLSSVVARFTAGLDQIGQMLIYRLLINLVYLADLALVWRLLKRLSAPSRLATFVAFAWSPLLLFQVAANSHNDSVMLVFMLLAVAALLGGRSPAAVFTSPSRPARLSNVAWLGALACLLLATLVKWVPALAGLFFGVAWVRCLAGWRQRLIWLGCAAALLGGLTLLVAAPWLQGLITAGPGVAAGSAVGYANWLVDVPAAWFAAHVLDRGGVDTAHARAVARVLFTVPAVAAFAVVLGLEVRRVWRATNPAAPRETLRAILGASARTLLTAIVLVSPEVHPWYFSWPLTLGLLLGWRDMTARVAIAYSLMFPPVAFIRDHTGAPPVDPLLVAYAVLPLALPASAWLRRQPAPSLLR